MTTAANLWEQRAETRPNTSMALDSLVYPMLWLCAIPPASGLGLLPTTPARLSTRTSAAA